MSDEQDEVEPLSPGAEAAKQGLESLQDWPEFAKDELGFVPERDRKGAGGERPKVDAEEQGRRRFRAWFFVLLMLVAFALFIVGAWVVSGRVQDPLEGGLLTGAGATTMAPVADVLAPVDCVLGDDGWDWTVDVTEEETTDRGTRVVGDFAVTNTSSESASIWWLRSATSGVGEVSVRWQAGGVVAPGESIGGDVSYASLNDGTESWMLPTHVVAVRDLPGCADVFERVDGVEIADEMFVLSTPLDLPFGPDAGQ